MFAAAERTISSIYLLRYEQMISHVSKKIVFVLFFFEVTLAKQNDLVILADFVFVFK